MNTLLSSIAITVAILALRKSSEPKTLEVRYLHTKAINPPLPPLPMEEHRPVLPYFLTRVSGGHNHVN